MATKKKTTAKGGAPRKRSAAGVRTGSVPTIAVRASAPDLQASKRIQLLVAIFTLLSIVFTLVTYWRYR